MSIKQQVKKMVVLSLLVGTMFAIFAPLTALAQESERQLPYDSHGGIIFHAWNMRFDLIEELLPEIAASGFNTIQTSPIGNSIFQFPNRSYVGTWWMLYQPIKFEIGNMLGTEAEFRSLTAAANEMGLRVIVDAIPNHTTSWWNEIDDSLRRPELFHSVPGDGTFWDRSITQFDMRNDSRRSRLLGLVDFYTGNPEFQALYMDFLSHIIEAGASGFRYDAMVHIELPYPYDSENIASDFWPRIQAHVDEQVLATGRTPFQYGEILGRWHADYLRALPGMLVTADRYGYHVRDSIIRDQTLGRWDHQMFMAAGYENTTAERFVLWVESHDTYGNAGISRDITDEQMRVGWAFITVRQGTTPLFLVRPGDGFVNNGQMFYRREDGSYGNNWGHRDFFQDETIVAINWFANYFINQPERISDYDRQIALIERGPEGATTGIVIINIGDENRPVNFPVQMVDDEYECHVTGATFTVSNGYITGPDIAGVSVLVIYNPGAIIDIELPMLFIVTTSIAAVLIIGGYVWTVKKRNKPEVA